MPPRLRASCDACHSAKIKCVKTDTGCQRCDHSAGELTCNRSPVLPRIYRKKTIPSHHERSPTSQPERSPESLFLHHLSGAQNGLSQPTSIYPAAPVAPVTASLSTFDQQSYGSSVDAEPNSFFWQYLPQDSTGVPQVPTSWPSSFRSTPTTTTTPSLTNAPTPASATPTTSLAPAANQAQASDTRPIPHYLSADPSTPSPEWLAAKTPCSCYADLLEAMQLVNSHTTSCSPELDVVLCANRIAVKYCLTSLQCSDPFRKVSHDSVSSCATIASGLLDRILSSYQAAFKVFCAGLDGETGNGLGLHGDGRVGDREDEDDENIRMVRRKTTVQLRFGSFAFERSEQVLWAREIVTREAGKIQETLKEVKVQDQGTRSVLLAQLMERCDW